MTTGRGNNARSTRSGGVWGRWIVVTALITVFVCAGISWALTSNLAAAKATYTSDITRIDSSLGHLKDTTAALDKYASYQDSSVQTKLDEIDGQLSGINSELSLNLDEHDQFGTDIAGMAASAKDLKTKTDGLSTSVAGLSTDVAALKAKTNGAILMKPTYTENSAIALSVTTDVAQTVAFRVEFRPTTEIELADTTLEAALKTLYGAATPTVALTTGSTSVRGDYNVYWKSATGKYCLGSMVFTTAATSLTASTQTKTLTYAATGSFEIIITPVYVTGSPTGSW